MIPRVRATVGVRQVVLHPWLPLVLGWAGLVGIVWQENGGLALLTILGFVGGLIAGLIGVGGAIVMIPLLLNVPGAIGLPPLDPHTVAGITIVQVAVASVFALAGHVGAIDVPTTLRMGLGNVLGAGVGGIVSSRVGGGMLEVVFAILATLALLAVARPQRSSRDDPSPRGPLPTALLVTLGSAIGLLAGVAGAGGAFLIMPVLLIVVRLEIRTAIATSLAIVFMASVSGSLGKAVTGQVDWYFALALVVGALPGSRLGASLSTRTSRSVLTGCLVLVLAAASLVLWANVASDWSARAFTGEAPGVSQRPADRAADPGPEPGSRGVAPGGCSAANQRCGGLRAATEAAQQAPDRSRVVDLAAVGDPHDGDRDADIRDPVENAVLPNRDAPDPLSTRT